MTTVATDSSSGPASARPLFTATIFVGSFLLFLMQPMIARMALPRLGGTPAVWNSAMLVYQLLLLGGYAYAHIIGRLTARIQAGVHLALLAGAALWLPIGLNAMTMPADASPIVWVPWLLLTSIAPLFLAVSAQAPLIQRWLALREPATNPYALYVASNLGSFAGLIAYPLIVEPLIPLAWQSWLWSVAYAGLLVLMLLCARLLPSRPADPSNAADVGPSPNLWRRMHWIALAAVPSGLILSTTLHLTTDIIAMPLIWVIPLGLYLLSFSFAFSDRARVATAMSWAFPLVLIVAGTMAGSGKFFTLWSSIAADLLLLFATSVTLHHRLYRLRPDATHLTGFYLCMAIGGVLGGVFCALVAPATFDALYEYPILVVAAALLMPLRTSIHRLAPYQRGIITIIALLLSLLAGGLLLGPQQPVIIALALVIVALLARLAIGHRILFAALIAALMLGLGGWSSIVMSLTGDVRTRSYFGIYTIGTTKDARTLYHGTTAHGTQLLIDGLQTYPTNYYAPLSGIGIAMRAVPSLFGPNARIRIAGLGAGTLACYAQPGQDWRFYEIDPAVVGIARNSRYFTFLSRCLPNVPVEIGDARLRLAEEATGSADLLAIDAFSSDSIPMHLLTREAIANYARVVAPNGLVLFHISNRYVDLRPVLAAAARDGGWRTAIRDYDPPPGEARYHTGRSLWVAFSRSPETIDRLRRFDPVHGWTDLPARAGFKAWTDDYGSILPLLHQP